ncbi:conserved hypothetical protein [Haloferula helveola]|uniref:Uncharacterized protein n=1 Tax=Haloferula helveola TaxID=490095 RepID=A0ABM7RJG3_9BACT|nr:conserved hypothetical protein [Haloferula helveola]
MLKVFFPLLIREPRSVSYTIVFGIWGEVLLYCLLHDQYLVRLAPEHFTVYHPPLWGIENEPLLAAAWAFRASVGPGIVLGLAALFVGRLGRWPKMPVTPMLKAVALGLVVTELCGLSAGAYSWFTGRTVYPEIIYPELTRPLITSQSIQVTCYLAGAVVGLIFLLWILRWRMRARA